MLIKLAARNLLRNRRRSLLTLSGIGMGLMLIIFFQGFMSGLDKQITDSFINQTGHIQIHAKGYEEQERLLPLDLTIDDPDRITEITQTIPEIKGIEKKIEFGALISTGNKSISVLGMGFQPEEEKKVSTLAQSIIEGNYLDENAGYALVGKKLAQDLKLHVGSLLIVVATTAQGAMNAIELEVKGIVYTSNSRYDSSAVFLSLKDAQRLLRMENRVTKIVIALQETEQTDNVGHSLTSMFAGSSLEIRTWKELGETVWRTAQLRTRFFDIISLVVITVAALGITNTMLMSVFERTREIGTMMALGITAREVLSLFLLESLILGTVGGALGGIVGGSLVKYFAAVGLSLSGTSALQSTAIGEVIYAQFSWLQIFLLFILAQVISVLSALYPAHLASRLEPVEALRHV